MRPTYEFPELPVLHGALLTRLSDDDFFELCQANPSLGFERNAQQEIIIMPPAGSDSSESGLESQGQLWLWNRKTRLGHVYESSAGFKLPDNSVRSPDAAWLSQAKWEQLTPAQRRKFPPVCPEFMVEVKSPSDDVTDLQAKMENCLTNGMQLGFLLDVENETAYVYRPGQPAETVQGYDQELSGELVLPGFQFDLRPLRR
ncbi:MAG: Uma2 family endonuclease [Hymenobacter sp.]|nr:MAG: Uma2 family endonuclease [Hymenobacter sp.]